MLSSVLPFGFLVWPAVTTQIPILVVLGWVGAVAAIVGAYRAIWQENFKRMLAYSSVSSMGLIMLGFSLGTETGFAGGLFYLLADTLMKAALFGVAGAASCQYGAQYSDRPCAIATKHALGVGCIGYLGIVHGGHSSDCWIFRKMALGRRCIGG